MRLMKTANVDEVFVDLCRQIIRKDHSGAPSYEEELVHHGHGREKKPSKGHKGGRSGRKKRGSVCVVL